MTAELVRDLLRDQHPDLADLPVTFGARGWDNQLWRLGGDLAVRLPWATESADALLLKEHRLAARAGAAGARFPSRSVSRRPRVSAAVDRLTTWCPRASPPTAPRSPAARRRPTRWRPSCRRCRRPATRRGRRRRRQRTPGYRRPCRHPPPSDRTCPCDRRPSCTPGRTLAPPMRLVSSGWKYRAGRMGSGSARNHREFAQCRGPPRACLADNSKKRGWLVSLRRCHRAAGANAFGGHSVRRCGRPRPPRRQTDLGSARPCFAAAPHRNRRPLNTLRRAPRRPKTAPALRRPGTRGQR